MSDKFLRVNCGIMKIPILLSVIMMVSCSVFAVTYTYDDLNRLVSVQYASTKMISYSYDEVGNMVEMVIITPDVPELDSNSNGIPDVWELSNGLQLDFPAGHDHDNDGLPDTDEYIAGTNPTNSTEYFSITNVFFTGTNLIFSWNSVTGRLYSIFSSTNLIIHGWSNIPGETNIPGTGSSMVYTNTSPQDKPGFYRVKVELGP